MNIVAPAHRSWLGMLEIVVKLAGVIIKSITQPLKRGGLDLKFFVRLFAPNRVRVATDDAKSRSLAHFCRRQDFNDNLVALSCLVQPGANVEADGLKTFGLKLLGKVRIGLWSPYIHETLQIIVSRIAQGGDDFLDDEF